MKILCLFRSDIDETTRILSQAWEQDHQVTDFVLADHTVDYDLLVDIIFQNDRVITWF